MDRRIQHLHLRTPSDAAARAALPVLQDALRCASLPGDGQRLLLVRHLALGAVNPRLGAQALAQHIEQAVAQAGWQWVEGGTPAAAQAPAVWFASPMQARVSLALAWLQGTARPAWYWPLAVPEVPRLDALPAHDRPLQRIAHALASGQVAAAVPPPALLAAWLQALLARHAPATVAQALGPVGWERAVLAWPGLAAEAGTPPAAPFLGHAGPAWAGTRAAPGTTAPVPGRADLSSPGVTPTQAEAAGIAPSTAGPMLEPAGLGSPVADAKAAGRGPSQPAAETPTMAPGRPHRKAAPPARRRPGAPPGPSAELHGAPGTLRAAPLGSVPAVPALAATPAPAPQALPARAAPASAPLTQPSPSHAQSLPTGLQATQAGGLLFLLPVFTHLGFIKPEEADAPAALRALLGAVLHRLRLPLHDAAWALADAHAPALAPPPSLRLRAWLRRHAHLGLARLVLRPGRLALSPLHVDLHFAHDQADLRIRRLGLDISPGWHATFGAVITFHYGPSP